MAGEAVENIKHLPNCFPRNGLHLTIHLNVSLFFELTKM